ncbi:MAG: (2Fe-2S) ferredoxin domain-containing protein [Actinomycetota bacterium]
MYKSHKQVSEFNLEGKILDLLVEDGKKLKYLRLATALNREYLIKLSKELRTSLNHPLIPGDWVQVAGIKKLDKETGKIKLKAYSIVPITSDRSQPLTPQEQSTCPNTQAKILVCQKSDCQKRGGVAVCQALEAALSDRGLKDRVAIQGTGCLKQCKAGPNIVLMPDKTRYSRIAPAEIPRLIEKHFLTEAVSCSR